MTRKEINERARIRYNEVSEILAQRLRSDQKAPGMNRVAREFGIGNNQTQGIIESAEEKHTAWILSHFAAPGQ